MTGRETDVLIVGGGPAGLAAALAARAHGLRVVVAEAATPPIDKACGEGLMPDSLAALRGLGVTIPEGDSFPFRGIRFLGRGTSVDASFPSGCGVGLRRTVLHQRLAGHAEAAGATLLWGRRVTDLCEDQAMVGGEEIHFQWMVGADGERSPVRRWAGLDGHRRNSRRFGFRRHYRVEPWTDCMEIYWGANCQVYVTPIAANEVCVALISRDAHLRLDEALAGFPEVVRRLSRATPSTKERGAVTASRRLQRVAKGRVALIGDASGSVDAITGEGLCLAFRQAGPLARSLASAELGTYEREHARLMRRPVWMAGLMLSLDRFPRLRGAALPALASRPHLFSKLLAMHVGELPAVNFLFQSALPLGWGMLAARREREES